MRLKRLQWVLVFAAMAMTLTACKKKSEPEAIVAEPIQETNAPEETEEPEVSDEEVIPEGMVKSYLTGEYVAKEIGTRRPIAVMMNNVKAAVPQAGIGNAGIVYEAPVEGGITRLMSVIEDYDDLEKIGSMRSCRDYYIFYASGFNAIYVHYGQSAYALPILDLPEVNNLSGLAGYSDSVFYRTTDRQSPHNAYTSFEGIQKGIELCNYSQEYDKNYQGAYTFIKVGESQNLPGEWEARHVSPGYYLNDPWFEYNEEDGLYYRYQYGDKHIDQLTDEHLAYKNVVLQYSSWRNYDENGYLNIDVDAENKGVYITNGKAIPITWKKHDPWGATYYYDENGYEITFNTGKTWVCIVQDTLKDRVVVGQDASATTQNSDTTGASDSSAEVNDTEY